MPLWVAFLVNPLLALHFLSDPSLGRWLVLSVALFATLLCSPRAAVGMVEVAKEVNALLALIALGFLHMALGAPLAEGLRLTVMIGVGSALYLYLRTMGRDGNLLAFRLMVVSGSLLGIYSIVQAFGGDVFLFQAESWMYRTVTTLGHRNFTAVFLLTCVFLCLELLRLSKSSSRWFTLIQTVLIFLGLLATGSRVPIAIASVSLLVGSAISKRRILVSLGALVVLLTGGWLIFIGVLGEFPEIITRTETVFLRLDLYQAMYPLLIENPLLGLGGGSFSHQIPKLMAALNPDWNPGIVFLHAHSLPAELLIEYGAVGLILGFIFLYPIIKGSLITPQNRRSWLLPALGAWILTNLYDVNVFAYGGWVTFWLITASLRTQTQEGLEANEIQPKHRLSTILLLSSLALVTCMLTLMSTSSFFVARAQLNHASGKLTEASAFYSKAKGCAPLPLLDAYRAAVASIEAGQVRSGLNGLLEIEAVSPAFSFTRYNLSVAYLRLDDMKNSRIWLIKHLEAYPGDRHAKALREALDQSPKQPVALRDFLSLDGK